MDIYELAEQNERNPNLTADVIAETGFSMALDNGSDMLGVNAREHAKSEWWWYVEHALNQFNDILQENGHEALTDEEFDKLLEASRSACPNVMNGWDLDNPESFNTDE